MEKTTRTMLASRCSQCNEAVGFNGYKELNAFLNTGRVCDACVKAAVTKALAEDSFARIEKSVAAQEAFARR